MVSDILYRKKIGIPYLSVMLILCCLLVSIPTYFEPRHYFVFGSSFKGYEALYPWQNLITSQFEHGSFYVESKIAQGLPLLVHLVGNVVVIGVFGSIAERVLGTSKFFQLSVIAAFTHYLTRVIIDSYGNGASGIAWAYGPIALFMLIKLYKLHGKSIYRDPLFYISTFLLFMMWIVITAGSEWTTILIHTIASIVGCVFIRLNRTVISDRLIKITVNNENAILYNRRIILGSMVLPTFLLVLLVLSNNYTL